MPRKTADEIQVGFKTQIGLVPAETAPPLTGELRADLVRQTIVLLKERIDERFPGSGLGEVAATLVTVAQANDEEIARARRPIRWLRVLIGLAIASLIAIAVWVAIQIVRFASGDSGSVPELIQGVDSAMNELVFLGLALLFLSSAETRLKRRRVLAVLHRLRGLAHVVDMHQLTKDPEYAVNPQGQGIRAPRRHLNRFELERYLDYCSEMLALTGKLAALHLQYTQDPVVLSVAREIEELVTGLARKIWQKIMFLGALADAMASDRTA
ncbi:MAG: hypothetical protein R3E12_07125 [Candidatus Eisenbacteria bacterium]